MSKPLNNKLKRVIFVSDFHGILVDKDSLSVFLNIINNNKVDEIVLNGDVLDLPYLSRHNKKLFELGIMKGYSEVKEVEFVKKFILTEIAKATKANVVYRLGNHEERITSPFSLTKEQLDRLAVLFKEHGSTELPTILDLKKYGIEYDPSPIRDYYGMFSCVHGLSLAKKAAEKNIYEYMGSGTSGHTHRLNSTYITNRHNSYCWLESGCMRVKDNVEYLPTAKVADWVNGFVSCVFDLSAKKPTFFAKTHAIVNGKCEFSGSVYRA